MVEGQAVTARGGSVITAGLPATDSRFTVNPSALVTDEKSVRGSYMGSCVPARDLPMLLAMYKRGKLPVDKLKIDRCFVQELPAGRHSGAIVSAIVQLAHSLDLVVVAEGVENAGQKRFLTSLGCDVMQGMGISPPLAADQMLDWLNKQPHAQHTLVASDPSNILLSASGGIF